MTDPTQVWTKRRVDAPAGFFEVEAAGLRWLDVPGGAAVPEVLHVSRHELRLPRVREVGPTAAAARAFGSALAVTHAAGAGAFGCPPAGWEGDGFIGPLRLPHRPAPNWGIWFAQDRLLPYLRSARDSDSISSDGAATVGAVLDRLADPGGDLAGPEVPPARIHGDLWNGNVLWGPDGVVLIDPAAHGGHPETDLAMLALFHVPYLEEILEGYQQVSGLPAGWPGRVGLHQLHPLLVHATLFGTGYGRRAEEIARAYC